MVDTSIAENASIHRYLCSSAAAVRVWAVRIRGLNVSWLYPGSGSQQTASIGTAVRAAYRELVIELLKVVDLDSRLANRGELRRRESYAALLARAGRDAITVEASAPMPF